MVNIVIADEWSIFLTISQLVTSHILDVKQKAAGDTFDCHPVTHELTSDIPGVALQYGHTVLHWLDNKTTISCLLQATVKSIASKCYHSPPVALVR